MRSKNVLFTIIIIIFNIFLLINWSIEVKALITLIIIQIFWVTRMLPLAQSSIILIIILSFHFFDYEETLSYLGSSLVWLLFSTFILSYAFINTGLANRIALKILQLSKRSIKYIIFMSFIIQFILTIFIPTSIGKAQLVSSIFNTIIEELREIGKTKNIGKSLFIGIAYVSSISAAFVPTGAGSTIYAFGIFSSLIESLNYFTWIIYIGVPIVLFMFILGFIFIAIFPTEYISSTYLTKLIDNKIEGLGNWRNEEFKMIFIMFIIIFLWLTQPLHNYSISLIGMLGAMLVCMPFIGVIKWEDAKKSVDWDLMIFFAATLMLSNMLIDTGTLDVVTSLFIFDSETHKDIFVVIALILLTVLLRIVFVNALGFMTIIIPLSISIGQQLDFSTIVISIAVYLASVPGFILITQSPVHLISYSYQHFNKKDLFKVGLISLTIWVLIIILSVFYWWSLLFDL